MKIKKYIEFLESLQIDLSIYGNIDINESFGIFYGALLKSINAEKIDIYDEFKIKDKNFDMNMYKNILLISDNEKMIGLINYCIVPSMKGKDKLFIRNIYCITDDYLDDIIKSLCFYCEKNNHSIFTSL